MIEQEIGRRIKEIRKQKKIPQEKLAEMIGISPNYMSAVHTTSSWNCWFRSSTVLTLRLTTFSVMS